MLETRSDAAPPTTEAGGTNNFRIYLLASFRVWNGAGWVGTGRWRLRKAKSLVKLLALAQNHRLHREKVLDLLWPHRNPASAAQSLYQVLHVARRTLGLNKEGVSAQLELEEDTIALTLSEGQLWVDATAFKRAAERARTTQDVRLYREALILYAGDLLPEDQYEEWVVDHRSALRENYIELLFDLAQLYSDRQEQEQAIELLQKVVELDASHEPAHTALMHLYFQSGRRSLALRQYQRLEASLQEELDVSPSPSSQQLYQSMLAHTSPDFERHSSATTLTDQATEGNRAATERDVATTSTPPTPPNNLPVQLTNFIGRKSEIEDISRVFHKTRLLTLLGPGGAGKTRLAHQLVSNCLPTFSDGAWWVDLAALTNPAYVAQAIAVALLVREVPDQPIAETLIDHIRARRLLLVLDNCEHLVTNCAHVVETLLHRCPHLHILTTSRQPLRVPGERCWPVPPLSLPDPGPLSTPEELMGYEAIELFVDRATEVVPTFRLTLDNAGGVVRLCRHLDGLPLAIELAAARISVLTIEQIIERLDNRFTLLNTGPRTGTARHQTLTKALDWSYTLLNEKERVLFQRLSIFAGTFSLDAVQGICATAPIEDEEILDLLSSLVDKSLVVVETRGKEARYRLLETVRHFGKQKLRESGETGELSRHYLKWFLCFAQRAFPHLFESDQESWMERLDEDWDNIRAALFWSWSVEVDLDDVELCACLAWTLVWFFYLRGHWTEAGNWYGRLLTLSSLPSRPRLNAIAHAGCGAVAGWHGATSKGQCLLERGVEAWREAGDKQGLAVSLIILGVANLHQGNNERAFPLLEESLALVREMGYKGLCSVPLMHLGDAVLQEGNIPAARRYYEEGLAIQRQVGDRWHIAQLVNNLGEIARLEQKYTEAAARYEESLILFRELGNRSDVARSLHNLAQVAQARGDLENATRLFLDSLSLYREQKIERGIAECLTGLAAQAGLFGECIEAVKMMGAAQAQFEKIGATMWPSDLPAYERNLEMLQNSLSVEAFDHAWAVGQRMDSELIIKKVLALSPFHPYVERLQRSAKGEASPAG